MGEQVVLRVEAAADVPAASDGVVDRAALGPALGKVVRERVQAGGLHVRIGREIELVVEAHARIAAFLPAGLLVMVERVRPGGSHLGIGREIALGREEGIRVAALAGTVLGVVRVGVLAGLEHVLVAGQVEQVVHERLAVVHHDRGVGEQVALEAADEVAAIRSGDGREAAGLRDGDRREARVEHQRVVAAPARQKVVARAVDDDVVARAAEEAVGEGRSLQHVVTVGSRPADAAGEHAVGAGRKVLDPRVGRRRRVRLREGRHAVERLEVLGERILLAALGCEGRGVGQRGRRGAAQRHPVLAIGREGVVVAAEPRGRARARGEEVEGHRADAPVRIADELAVLHQGVDEKAVGIDDCRRNDPLPLAGDGAVDVHGLGLPGRVEREADPADLGERAGRGTRSGRGDGVLEHPLQLGGGDRDHGERVVEAQRVGDVELRDVARRLARRRVGGWGKLRRAAARRRERADRVADAAAVLDRDRDRPVELLGVPEVGIRREVAEVGLFRADLAAAAFQVHAGAAEDVAVLLADDVGDARGLLDTVVVDVEALDHLLHEEALGAGREGGGGRAVELRHRGVVHRDGAGGGRVDRVADDVALVVEGDVEAADIGILGSGVHQG